LEHILSNTSFLKDRFFKSENVAAFVLKILFIMFVVFLVTFSNENEKLLLKYCDGEKMGFCVKLGFIEANEIKNYEEKMVFKKACDKGNFKYCYKLANQISIVDETNFVRELYENACDGNILDGCIKLGNMQYSKYKIANGDVVVDVFDSHHKRAIELFTKACDGGAPDGCIELARYREDHSNGKSRFRKRCDNLSLRECIFSLSQKQHFEDNLN
jgi:hypothetical protein